MRRLLGTLLVIAPFVAAGIAAGGARHDLRIAEMAVGASVTAWLLLHFLGATNAKAFIAFGLATLVACLIAIIAGAFAPFGVIAVAAVVAGFSVVGQVMLARAKA